MSRQTQESLQGRDVTHLCYATCLTRPSSRVHFLLWLPGIRVSLKKISKVGRVLNLRLSHLEFRLLAVSARRAVLTVSYHHLQEVAPAQLSLYVHTIGLFGHIHSLICYVAPDLFSIFLVRFQITCLLLYIF